MRELEGHTCGIIPPAAHTAFNKNKGLNNSLENCRVGKILLTPPKFSFPSMTLPKYDVNVVLW